MSKVYRHSDGTYRDYREITSKFKIGDKVVCTIALPDDDIKVGEQYTVHCYYNGAGHGTDSIVLKEGPLGQKFPVWRFEKVEEQTKIPNWPRFFEDLDKDFEQTFGISKSLMGQPKQEGGKKDAIGDPNKPRLSLIPIEALWALGGALTYGEKHYGSHNWRAGIKISILLDAALRHINEFADGEDIDQKSQNHHLGNAMANLAMAISTLANKPEFDDRYKKDEK